MKAFGEWLAELLGQDRGEVEKLLKSERAVHFLMAWSLFESRCVVNAEAVMSGKLLGGQTIQPLVNWLIDASQLRIR